MNAVIADGKVQGLNLEKLYVLNKMKKIALATWEPLPNKLDVKYPR
jgi:hypothetical protein